MAEEGQEDPKPKRTRGKIKKSVEESQGDTDTSGNQKLDKILQDVVAQSTKDAMESKKKKKKVKSHKDAEVLESLRKGEGIEGLHKEEDSAIIANTYKSDDNFKNEQSNKQRQRKRDKIKSNIKSENETEVKEHKQSEEQDEGGKKKKTPKKKSQLIVSDSAVKGKEPSDEAVQQATEPKAKPRKKKVKSPRQEDKEEEKEDQATKEVVEEKEATLETSASPGKKKKKKAKAEEKEVDKEEEEGEDNPAEGTQQEQVEDEATDKKKRKKKKKERIKEAGKEVEEQDTVLPASAADVQDLGEVMAVMIHRTDRLKTDFQVQHPVVRVHVVDEETGEYVAKQHMDRAVTSFYETSNKAVKSILPMMTQPFDFKEKRSTIPVWEDLLVFNENFNYFIQPKPKVILFFELLDFVSMAMASHLFRSQQEEGGWYRIAWGFLKVVGANGKVNIGQKLRLQLFSPVSKRFKGTGQLEVYHWWKSGERTPYPSTLYISLKCINQPMEVDGTTRSMFATHKEMSNLSYKDLKDLNWSHREKKQDGNRTMTTWTRLFGQLCRVPNSLSLTLTSGRKGCFVIEFSHDGRHLACACEDGRDYPIYVYEIPSGSLKGKFDGHFGIIYSLNWSKHNTQLVSASSDGTVRIWDISKFDEPQTRLLPHPGFVYTAKFHPRVDSIVVSGGYDEVLRVWDVSISEDAGMLQQEIEEHVGHINSICFDHNDGQKMYSADNVGSIFVWNVFVTEQASHKHFVRDWTKYLVLKDPELKDIPINHIQMHPSGRRLLVHARNNVIFMFDLRVQRIMQKYFGAENLKEKIHSTIAPCGSFVLSGSEDGKVYAWNTDTGDQVAVYTQLNYQHPVTDVHYHPRDHMLAICSRGEGHPIYVYKYDPSVTHGDAFVHPMPPMETTEVENFGKMKTSTMKETELLTARSKVSSKEEFQIQQMSRYQQVMKKMETATMQMAQMPGTVVPENLLSPRLDMVGWSGAQSTWKMQHDMAYSLTPRSQTQPPGFLSPHAPAGYSSHLATQISSQRGYAKATDGGWRPTFSEIGRQGDKNLNLTYFGRPPHLSLSTSLGKPQFTFESPIGKSLKQELVAVLYDYRAQRSDELTLFKGDVVRVLYKDNENWWMGEMENGKQGFFLANYVTHEDDGDAVKKTRTPSISSSGMLTAIKTKSGELTFVSSGEQSDEETPSKGTRRKQSKDRNSNQSSNGAGKISKEQPDSIDDLLEQKESIA